jgi:hypothetical protein
VIPRRPKSGFLFGSMDSQKGMAPNGFREKKSPKQNETKRGKKTENRRLNATQAT